MSGADQNAPELRAPSIKGAMRFWFRAMMGKVLNDDVEKVKYLESKLFGFAKEEKTDIGVTDDEVKSKASDISIELSIIKINTNQNKLNAAFTKNNRGVTYLSFPFLQWNNVRKDYDIVRHFIDIKSSYALKLTRVLGKDDNALEVAVSCMWLLANFGNVGSRSRRGFGSLRITGIKENYPLVDFNVPAHFSDLSKYYKDNLRKTADIFAQYAKFNKFSVPAKPNKNDQAGNYYPNFDSFSCWRGCLICKNKDVGWDSWDEALDYIGHQLRRKREDQRSTGQITKTTDYVNYVSKYINNSRLDDIDLENDIFGLPNQIRSSSRKATAIVSWSTKGSANRDEDGDGDLRRASPLLIKPILCGEKYYILLQYFKSLFLPGEGAEIIKPLKKTWPSTMPMPQQRLVKKADYDKLEKFVDNLNGLNIDPF
jgi:CRISPR-associated protein Cmr1